MASAVIASPDALVDRLAPVFADRRVLVTGHTGFKGAWMSAWLHSLGAKVAGFSLAPDNAQQPLFELVENLGVFELSRYGDVCDMGAVAAVFEEFRPEIVFHLAAQPLVRLSYAEPVATFSTNVLGTAHVLDAVRVSETPVVVCVTSDKCYENAEQVWPYRETDRMGGWDPYSASKGAAEIVIDSYRRSFFGSDHPTSCASGRAGNVIGGGDFSADRLVPDMVRATEAGVDVVIRRPSATRPWQFVLESLSGYLTLAAALWSDGERYVGGWNFGPHPSENVTVGDFVQQFASQIGGLNVVVSEDGPHEASRLALDISKATTLLDWWPILTMDERIAMTVEWYQKSADGTITPEFVQSQIKQFENRWRQA